MAGVDTFASSKAQTRIARILAEMKKRPITRDEVQGLIFCSKPTARRYLAYLREQERVHIANWRSSGHGRFAPVYALGAGRDVPEPAGMTKQERNAMEWCRIKADRDRHDRVKAMARVQRRIEQVRSKPQPWFAALMGARA